MDKKAICKQAKRHVGEVAIGFPHGCQSQGRAEEIMSRVSQVEEQTRLQKWPENFV